MPTLPGDQIGISHELHNVKGSGREGQHQQQQTSLGGLEEGNFAVHASVYSKV